MDIRYNNTPAADIALPTMFGVAPITTPAPETIEARIARQWAPLNTAAPSKARLESLTIAHDLGVDDATFETLCRAGRVSRKATIVLPAHRLEGMSRGKGWCRQGKQASAIWGERVDGGYHVDTTGRWVVGGNDGFARKGETPWDVSRIKVAGQTWTIAD